METIIRIGADFSVSNNRGMSEYSPSVATLSDGRVVIAWTAYDYSSGEASVRSQFFAPDGSKVGSEQIVTSGRLESTYITPLLDGGYVIPWSDGVVPPDPIFVRARVFNADGSPRGTEIQITDGSVSAITTLADGRFVIAWQDIHTSQLRFQLFNPDSSTDAIDIPVAYASSGSSTSSRFFTVGGLTDGRFVVTWSSETGEIKAQIFNGDGSTSTHTFLVNRTNGIELFVSSIAPLRNGQFVISWYDTGVVRAQVFGNDGSYASDEILVTPNSSGHGGSALSANSAGQFLVTWVDGSRLDTLDYEINSQLFNPDGTAISNQQIVNANGLNTQQYDPAIALLQDGRYLVTWQEVGLLGIRAQFITLLEPLMIVSGNGAEQAIVSVPENSTDVFTVVALHQDVSTSVTYSITGGADADRFAIDATTGVISFVTAPDFEIPTDVDSDGKYNITVAATDGAFSDIQAVTVEITNLNEAPSGLELVSYLSPLEETGSIAVEGAPGSDIGYLLEIQPDGKFLVAGINAPSFGGLSPPNLSSFSISRLFSDGTIDNSFGQRGTQVTSVSGALDWLSTVLIQSDQKILLTGHSLSTIDSSGIGYSLIRLNTDGSLDNTFGIGGKAFIEMPIVSSGAAALQEDGKIIFVGNVNNGADTDVHVVRLNSDGSPDVSFGVNGFVINQFSTGNDNATAVIVQNNGKILVIGSGSIGSTVGLGLLQLNSDGSVDTNFGISGTFVYDISQAVGSDSYFTTGQVYKQSDGKILVIGDNSISDKAVPSVSRLNPDGSLDATFGVGGTALIRFGISEFHLTRISAQPDGKIVLSGDYSDVNGSSLAAVRLNSDGTIDTGFGEEGLSRNFQSFLGGAHKILSDGSIIVSGTSQSSDGVFQSTLTKLTSDGLLQQSVGSNILAIVEGTLDGSTIARLTATDPDSIVSGFAAPFSFALVAGAGDLDNSSFHIDGDRLLLKTIADFETKPSFSIRLKVTDAGGLTYETTKTISVADINETPTSILFDTTTAEFERTASITLNLGPGTDYPSSIAIQTDGKFLVSGETGLGSIGLWRINTDGTIDTSFGSDGFFTLSVSGLVDFPATVLAQTDGTIIVSGDSWDSSSQTSVGYWVIRLTSDGTLDNTFGTSGKQVFSVQNQGDGGFATLQSDGKVVVVGNLLGAQNLDFHIIRLNTDGTLDSTFGSGGSLTVDLNQGDDRAKTALIQTDGKIVVVGAVDTGNSFTWGITRLNVDGSLDTGFGVGGKLLYSVGNGIDWDYNGAVIQPDGKILVASTNDTSVPVQAELIRLNSDGSLDGSFGVGGWLSIPLPGTAFSVSDLTLQSDLKILLGGSLYSDTSSNFGVVRINSDGTLDTTFGNAGIAIDQSGGFANTISLGADGTIFLGGSVNGADGSQLFGLSRFNINGTLDSVEPTQSLSFDEGNAVGAVLSSLVSADPDTPGSGFAEPFTFTLVTGDGDTDNSSFEIVGDNQLALNVVADFETKPSFSIRLKVTDAGGLTYETTKTISVTNVNETPAISSDGGGPTAAISAEENSTAVTTVTASDPDSASTLTYLIVGGADAAKFQIDGSTGVLSFIAAPDFEVPGDVGADNVYDVTVQVSDGSLNDSQAIAVTVTNVNEAPSITSNGAGAIATISVAENSTGVTTVTATDPDAGTTLAYSILGGSDSAKFQIDSLTGVLSFIAAPDFEVPGDVGADNVYDVTVQVSDGSLTDTQALLVTVTDQLSEGTSGSNGDDKFLATALAETFQGFLGSDTVSYELATAGIIASLSQPRSNTGFARGDTYSSIENLTGSAFGDSLTGDSNNNILTGGLGRDRLAGLGGDDTYVVNLNADGTLQDTITEDRSAGVDTIILEGSSTNRRTETITLSSNVENLDASRTGTSLLNFTGNGLVNRIIGNDAVNVVVGGGAGDDLDGRGNSDIYIVNSASEYSGDIIRDTGVGGTDEFRFTGTRSESVVLNSSTTGLERVVIGTGTGTNASTSGNANVNIDAALVSSALTIIGNNGSNNLTGTNFGDVIEGNGGNDRINGGLGSDRLFGGLGNDILSGGADADSFVFNTALNASLNRDTISDFNVADDTIELARSVFSTLSLGTLSASQFVVGTAALDTSDRIIYNPNNGALFYDSNGSSRGGSVQFATLSPNLALTNNDFLII